MRKLVWFNSKSRSHFVGDWCNDSTQDFDSYSISLILISPATQSVFRSTDRMLGFEPSDVGSIPARPAIMCCISTTCQFDQKWCQQYNMYLLIRSSYASIRLQAQLSPLPCCSSWQRQENQVYRGREVTQKRSQSR